MESRIAAFVAHRWGVPAADLRVELRPLHGGLESAVALARIRGTERHGAVPRRIVVKRLRAGHEREAAVYELLWRHFDRPPAVRLLGRAPSAAGTLLYLEEAQSSSSWPWADIGAARAVCRALARLHDSPALPREAFSWDYDEELPRSAQTTLALARAARDETGRRCWRRLGDLARVVHALPGLRRDLLAGGTTVIHGDVHPGNAILRADGGVVLIDWARARLGSPLEDVASWLQSLGCWEPQARRYHDTLMREYLEARAGAATFGRDLRRTYWLASASNGLSGAIRYHLAVVGDPASTDAARSLAWQALAAWQRVIRRAATLVSTNQDRCSARAPGARRPPTRSPSR